MGRVPYVTDEVAAPDAAAALARAVAGRGFVSNVHRTLAHVPALVDAFEQFSAAVRGSPLPARLRELVVLRVSVAAGNEYEWRRHTRSALEVDVTHEEIAAIGSGVAAPVDDEPARAVLALVDAHLGGGPVAEEHVSRCVAAVGVEGTVAVCAVLGWYLLVSAIVVPLGLIEDDPTPPAAYPMGAAAVDAGG